MARQPRCAAAGLPHLLDLRWCAGVSARLGEHELDLLRVLLAGALPRHQVALHAYALGRSRALLLLTPQTAQAPARLVQDLSRRLAVEMRKLHGHAGPLLAGRFRSAIVQAEPHLLDAMQYVEQLPAREGEGAASWRWTSAAVHCGSASRDELVTDHPLYWRTGNTPFEREAHHRARLAEPLGESAARRLEVALAGGWPLGDEAFLQGLAQQLHRRLVPRAPGRPRRPSAVEGS